MLLVCNRVEVLEKLMPDITLPHTFADGNTTNAAQVEENTFRSEVTPPTSLSVINGRLDDDNREAGWDLNYSHIQRGALTDGRSVGSTTNHHYFSENFPGFNFTTGDTNDKYQIIPGAAQSFYLPFTPSLVVFTWSIFAGYCDSVNPGPDVESTGGARLRLFINGNRIAHRIGPQCLTRNVGEWPFARHWAGHYFWKGAGVQKGWHSAGLGLAQTNQLTNVRVKRFDYVYFR